MPSVCGRKGSQPFWYEREEKRGGEGEQERLKRKVSKVAQEKLVKNPISFPVPASTSACPQLWGRSSTPTTCVAAVVVMGGQKRVKGKA